MKDEDIISPRPEPPPLRIHHLMACVVVTAAMFTLWRALYSQGGALSAPNVLIMTIWGGLVTIGLTFAIFSMYWQSLGYAGLTQPGQWLLIGFGFSAIRTIALMLFATVIRTNLSGDFWLMYRVALALMTSIVPIVFYLWCAWKVGDTRTWRIAFVAIAFAPIVCAPWIFFQFWGMVGSAATIASAASNFGQSAIKAIAITAAVIDDRNRRLMRYWTHWLGVGLSVLLYLSNVVTMVLFWINS